MLTNPPIPYNFFFGNPISCHLPWDQCLFSIEHSALKDSLMKKAVVAAFNQEKALVGAFSVIVQPIVEPMDRFAALVLSHSRHRHSSH